MPGRPANALSSRVMLASGIHAQPGVYALLIGSGVSRAAGIPTGWEIVKHLVQKAAAADQPGDAESHALAAEDPEAWWAAYGDGSPLGYSSLLAAIAPSSAARQGLLKEYFVASRADREAGLKTPTPAHRAVADLVRGGWVRLVITTNFDTLLEQALDTVGASYQRITRPEQIGASTPLAHADATVVKLHGDWTDLEFRNTIDELDAYPEAWVDLLEQVFHEYGLLVSGWSAEWDRALVRALESTPRRYPLYWDSRSSRGDAARDLVNRHGGQVIASASADELFTELMESVDSLQRLAQPPLTTAMAIARLKRILPDPLRRIELRDLILDGVKQVASSLAGAAPNTARDSAVMSAYLDRMLEETKPLLALLVHGVRYDDGTYTELWVEALQSLMNKPQPQPKALVQTVDELNQYPSLLALRAMSIEAVRQRKDDVMIALLTIPRWTNPFYPHRSPYAADVLHTQNVIDSQFANSLARSKGKAVQYPSSYLLKAALRDFFQSYGVEEPEYGDLCDDVEFRTGLVQHLLARDKSKERAYYLPPNWGEFLLRRAGWQVTPEDRFREDYSRRDSAAWDRFFEPTSLDSTLRAYQEFFRDSTNW